jgi:hypothetical protein
MLGLDPSRTVEEVRQLGASGELDEAIARLKGQGQITENERVIVKRAIASGEGMNPETLRELIPVLRKVHQENIEVASEYGKARDTNPGTSARRFSFDYRLKKRQEQGGPRSGQAPMPSSVSPEDEALINQYLQ